MNAALSIAIAFLLALPLGWEREYGSRSAGLRTYPLISVATCAFILLGKWQYASAVKEQADVFYGVLSGMAIFGSGVLMQRTSGVRGMATAASLWVTGAIGVGVGFGVPQISAALALLSLVALRLPMLVRRKAGTP